MKKNKSKLFTKKSLTVLCIIFSIAFVILTAVICIKNSKTSSVKLSSTISEYSETLIAKNKFAHTGIIKEKGEARFAFNSNQKEQFLKIYQDNQSAALVIRMKFTPTAAQKELLTTGTELPFNFGILYNDDFDKNGKLKEPLNSKISVYADLGKKLSYQDAAPVVVDFSMAIPKSDHFENFLPEGFFISSSVACQIESACAAPSLIGFDNSQSIGFYGFSSNGGVVNFQNTSVDFSGAALAFPVQNTLSTNMPEFLILLNDDEELKGKSVRLSIGGEKLYVKNSKSVSKLEFPSASLKNPFSNAELSENAECVKAFLMQGVPFQSSTNAEYAQTEDSVYKAVRTDPGLILNYNTKNWRVKDYEVFEWDRYPGILLFDILNYDIQNDFFRRLAYFVEKRGYKGKLWSDEVLADKHGYNAHDYSAESLAAFFNKATEENFKLNKAEQTLKKILIVNGLLIPDGDYVKAGEGGIVSISQESDNALRTKLLAHEAWHTLFFRDEDFRNFVAAVYYTFDADSRQFLLDFFESQSGLGYDIEDEYLMHNEFMAYILQQGLKYVPEYFVGRTNLYSVRVFTPELSQYVRDTNAKGFEDAAVILNDYVLDVYGISGGNVALINR